MQNISHNVLITGGEHRARMDYAAKLIKNWLCEKPINSQACSSCNNCHRTLTLHPNVVFVEPLANEDNENTSLGSIKIDQIRRIVTENQKANFENGLGIFFITHMHQATKSAANALLKAIEENHKNKAFIALAPSRMTVLATIASRMICHVVEPAPLPATCSPEFKNKIFDISQVVPKERFPFCAGFSSDRDTLVNELSDLQNACHLLLRHKQIPARFALILSEALQKTHGQLKRNINPRLLIEQLIFNEWPQLHI